MKSKNENKEETKEAIQSNKSPSLNDDQKIFKPPLLQQGTLIKVMLIAIIMLVIIVKYLESKVLGQIKD